MSNDRVLKKWQHVAAAAVLLAGLATMYACSSSASGATAKGATTQTTTKNSAATAARNGDAPQPAGQAVIDVTAAGAIEQPIVRTLRVTGSFSADEQAQVAAETAGRVVKTPVERGSRVKAGDSLNQISAVQTAAQFDEAQAN